MGLSGSRRGVLNVLRSVIALKEGFYIFKCYRSEVVPFYASIEELTMGKAIVVQDLMAMEMAMYISQIMPLKARWVDGNMSEDEASSHGGIAIMKKCSPYIFKIL